jgi:hypothetical protein
MPGRKGWMMLTCNFRVASLTARTFRWSFLYLAAAVGSSEKSTSKSLKTSGRDSISVTGNQVLVIKRIDLSRLDGSSISSPSGVPISVNCFPVARPRSALFTQGFCERLQSKLDRARTFVLDREVTFPSLIQESSVVLEELGSISGEQL